MIRHILGIAAGKGGVGKSAVAVNLALAFCKMGRRVGILDADLYGPSVRHMLPEERLPEESLEHPGKILPALSKEILYISIDFFRANHQGASLIRAPIANSAIVQFLHSVEWGDLDYLVIDFPPGTGDIQLTLAQQANLSGAILVTLPQEISLLDVRKATELFIKAKVPILGIVENMHGLFPGSAGAKLSEEIGAPLLGCLPFDPLICESADSGSGKCIKIFNGLAEAVERALGLEGGERGEVLFALKDSATLRVEWRDGLSREISLADLQSCCPCARCRSLKFKPKVEKVLADRVVGMGNYALSVQYCTGCSKGVYPFDMLRAWEGHV